MQRACLGTFVGYPVGRRCYRVLLNAGPGEAPKIEEIRDVTFLPGYPTVLPESDLAKANRALQDALGHASSGVRTRTYTRTYTHTTCKTRSTGFEPVRDHPIDF